MFLTRNVMLKYRAPVGRHFVLMEGEGGGGGGGGGSGADDPWKNIPAELKPTIQGLIAAATATEVAGLKNKNSELLGIQRQLKDQLAQFEGIDPDAMKALLKQFNDDQERGLLKDGKLDEVVKLRTERMQAAHQRELQAKDKEIEKQKGINAKLAERAVSEAVLKAATKAGARPEATEDIVLRAKGAGWRVNEDGDVVAYKGDDVIMGKDGKTPLTPTEWAESLRENAPHLWPPAQGSNAAGGTGTTKGGIDLSKLPPVERIARARELGVTQPAYNNGA